MKKLTIEWFKAAMARALWTFAEVILSMVTVGQAVMEVDWRHVLSVALVASIISICKSIVKGVPEASNDGVLVIDDNDPDSDLYTLQLNDDPAVWATKSAVTLRIAHAPATKVDTDEA